MNREEELIRSTTRAIASTVTEVPPLRLEPDADETRSPDGTGHAARGESGESHQHHWWSWGAPLAAAVVIVAIAVTLTLVRDMPNGAAGAAGPAASASPAGVPRYYVALRQPNGDPNTPYLGNELVAGDSVTGKVLATIKPPARTAFESVTASADDRTFAVFGVTTSTGNFVTKAGSLSGHWYLVRLAPGTAHPARLTRLPVATETAPKSMTGFGINALAASYHGALSGSGRELAVPEQTAAQELAVKVFSVATGQLLREWTTGDPSVYPQPALQWVHGDQDLALFSRDFELPDDYTAWDATVREWPAAGPSGDLAAVSRVAWTVRATKNPLTTVQNCVQPASGPVVISDNGQVFSCTTAGGWGPVGHLSFHTYPLAATTTATAKGRADYDVTMQKARYIPAVAWSSASGDALIGALIPYQGDAAAVADGLRVGVISHGRFTPLRLPASVTKSPVTALAF